MIVVALVICLAAIAVRIPGALRGRGLLSLGALVMLAGAIALAMPGPYLLIDNWLGQSNATNLIVRLLVFGSASAIALSLARVFNAYRVESFIRGPGGVAAIAVSLILLSVALIQMGGLSFSSPGLVAFNDSHWFRVYSLLGHLYPSLLAGALLVPVFRFVLTPAAGRIIRTGYALIGSGMAMLVLLSVLYFVASLGLVGVVQPLLDAVAWTAPISVVAGALVQAVGAVSARWRDGRRLATS